MIETERAKPGVVRVGWLSVVTDLRMWWRQPLAVALAIVAPAAVAVIVSNALGTLPQPTVTWAIVDEDQSTASEAFRESALDSEAIRDIVTSEDADRAEAQRRLDDGDVDAVIVLPSGTTDAIARGEVPTIEVTTSEIPSLGGDLAVLVTEEFTLRAWASSSTGTDTPWPIEIDVRAASGRAIDVAEHYAPAIGMFFVMLALGFAAQAQVRARQSGIVDRLRSTPASMGSVVIGHAVAGVAIGGASLITTLAVMGTVFDVSLGPIQLQIILIAAILVAYAGVAALIAAVARTPDQALMLAITVPFVFILASGGFSPPGHSARPWFAPLVPPTHALDAFAEIGVNNAGITAIVGSLAVLVVYGLVAASIAVWLEARR